MSDRARNIYYMFVATREFDVLNNRDYDDLPEAAARFAAVRSAIDRLETDFADQISGAAGRAVESKSVIRHAMRRKMVNFARTARALNIDDPGFRRLFSVPDEDNDQRLLASAREFVEEATRFAADFARLGITQAKIDALAADIAQMEAAMNAKASATIQSVGATAGIDEQIDEGMKAEIVLDAIMKNVYADNPVKLTEWKTARHVRRSSSSGTPTPPPA